MCIILFLLAALAAGAQSTTPNLGLTLPSHNAANWDTVVNQNFLSLDSYLSGGQALPSLLTKGPVTVGGGSATYRYFKTQMQNTGELDWIFLKPDGTPSDPSYSKQLTYRPWLSPWPTTKGQADFSVPVLMYDAVGGLVTQGRLNTYQLPDPTQCPATVTHVGTGSPSGACYWFRFVDSNSGYSLPISCSAPGAWSADQIDSAHYNYLTWTEATAAATGQYMGGYSNVIISRGAYPCAAADALFTSDSSKVGPVSTPTHVSGGVLSSFSACEELTPANAPNEYCNWTDNDTTAYPTVSLSTLAGYFYCGDQDCNTTGSVIVGAGKLWTLAGNTLNGGTGFNGRIVTGKANAIAAPTILPNTTGSTTVYYEIVGHDNGLGTKPGASAHITNGNASPNNTVTFVCYPWYQSADLIVSADGATWYQVALALPCSGTNIGGSFSGYNVVTYTDTTTHATPYTVPADTTADIFVDSSGSAGAGASIHADNGTVSGYYVKAGGTNILYYCSGGASAGSMCRGTGCSCSGGSWVDSGLRIK